MTNETIKKLMLNSLYGKDRINPRKKILVACEESQTVCKAFRENGHEAYSCDIQPCSGGHSEWHIQSDVLPILNGRCEFMTCDGVYHEINTPWDIIIAHPPCTYLSNAGAVRLYPKKGVLNLERYKKGLEAKDFFMQFMRADCDCICVENPTPSRIFALPQYTQAIQPYEYGDPYSKRTCLWLKGLPKLYPTNEIEPVCSWVSGGSKDSNGKRRKNCGVISDQKTRSKTFYGIAKAMADQWGGNCNG